MYKCLRKDGTLDTSILQYFKYAGLEQPKHGKHNPVKDNAFIDMTGTTGRFIEAVVWFYEATGDSLAFELAERFARFHLIHSTKPDGSIFISDNHCGHSHSYLGTLRGLVLFGKLTNQREYLDAVAAAFNKAVPYVVKESGWAPHDLVGPNGKGRFFDKLDNLLPEHATPGDAAQIAVWLAYYDGRVELFDDAERLVRCRLLPGQYTEADISVAPDKDVPKRNIGAWCVHAWPHAGKGCTNDVASAVLHTMVDFYHHVVSHSGTSLMVHLLFDYEDETVNITTARTDEAKITVKPKVMKDILIRVPGWAPRESVRLLYNGKPLEQQFTGAYLFIPRDILGENGEIVMYHALPERRTHEKLSKSKYDFLWKGDEIIGIEPNEGTLPFYPSL